MWSCKIHRNRNYIQNPDKTEILQLFFNSIRHFSSKGQLERIYVLPLF
ncbi:hypothetical protein LEP1GSC108_4023 [Leptospira weilii str. UI 13098]|uniref:Uncharacterized protein n=1 Tax=Leptospira weilii str. UI 13098 TaxID=1088542 RepID=M6Q7F5_9LEPT|nr:hypothetical protein LEP1GSC086_1881 [Leptospira weilii str. LNT 1234]EMN91536.1 hypothetical protein LEP1GSC108_4023 [Leptospira weilii str. UI 13098]